MIASVVTSDMINRLIIESVVMLNITNRRFILDFIAPFDVMLAMEVGFFV